MAEVLRRLGDERAFVVHGVGVDELPLDGTGILYDVTAAGIERREIVAAEYGLGYTAQIFAIISQLVNQSGGLFLLPKELPWESSF
jgi:anthranilate phosphoribosyltransferase